VKQNKKDSLVADVAFVLAEVERLQQLIRSEGLAALPRTDAFHYLPDPGGKGLRILCGRAAGERISSLADHAMRAAGIDGQVERKRAAQHLRSVLSQRFLGEERAVTITEVERALAEAGRLAAVTRATRTHFIPCHLLFVQDPPQFAIGPVRFMTRATFRSRLVIPLRTSRRELRDYRLVHELTAYYESFGWVAEVEIPDCDSGTSQARAQEAVTRALDCLHLLIGPGHSRKMRIGGPALRRDGRGSFTLSSEGLGYQISYPSAGNVGFEAGWFTEFENHPDYGMGLRLCGLALEAAVDPGLKRPLSHRFLDAIHWYGEAVRDSNPAARVVKYMTAIERMLMTEGANKDIASTIADRVAAFCCEAGSRASHDQWRADAQRAYSLRSKLVHGSLSPGSPRIMEDLGTVARVSQFGLIGALTLLGEPGLTDAKASSAKLARFYDEFVAGCRRGLG